jgi:nicotinamidase-related amidase
MARFPIVASKTGLLFFDTLNMFLHPDDLQARARLEQRNIIANMQRINEAARSAGIAVIYVQGDNRPDARDFVPRIVDLDYFGKPGEERGRITTPSPLSTPGYPREVIAELTPQPGDYIIKKSRWGSFFQTNLELSLRTAGINTLILSGGSLEIGIASTAYTARDMDLDLILLRDACTTLKPPIYDLLLDDVFAIFCRIMTVDEAIALFE